MNIDALRVEQTRRLRLKKLITMILGGLLLVAAIPYLILFFIEYGEKERQDLMRDYQVPQIFLARIIYLQKMPTKKLMGPGEVLVCAVGGYGSVEGIKELNEEQKRSTSKDRLPSEDGLWYLIFFSETRSTRIYLIENAAIDGVTSDSDQCVGERGSFEVIKKNPRTSGSLGDFDNAFLIRMKMEA